MGELTNGGKEIYDTRQARSDTLILQKSFFCMEYRYENEYSLGVI